MKLNKANALLALALITIFAVGVAVSAPALAGDEAEEARKVRKVRIHKMADCEGEECEDAEHHHTMLRKMIGDMDIDIECEGDDCDDHVRVFISEDGKVHQRSFKAGEPIEWIEDCEKDDCEKRVKVIVEKSGDADEIHAIVSQAMDEACEGEDCRKKVIVIDGDAAMHKAHAMAGHPVKWVEKACEGDDCDDDVRVIVKKIKAGDEDDVNALITREIEAECDGEDCTTQMIFIGGDDEMHRAHAMAGHRMVWNSEECEGDDCKHHKRIIVRKGSGPHQVHGAGNFTWLGEGGGGAAMYGGKGGFLGVQLTELTDELRAHFGAPEGQGVMVGKVVADSAAETAGVAVGDIVLSVDGEAVGSADALSRAIRSREAGATVELDLLRAGGALMLSAVLGEQSIKAPHGLHTMMAFCGEGEDCDMELGGLGTDFDCGGAEECKVEVECEGDECTCTANGETIDCQELGLPHHE